MKSRAPAWTFAGRSPLSKRRRSQVRSAAAVLTAWLFVAGCASPSDSRRAPEPLLDADGIAAATPPAFLAGAVSLLLTNREDYTAHLVVTMTNGSTTRISGALFQQEGILLFVPRSETAPAQNPWTGRFRFLWNLPQRRGYVISESLRGYFVAAPLAEYHGSASNRSNRFASETIDAQACVRDDVTVTTGTGSRSEFEVWRPQGDGPPLRINSAPGTFPALTAELFEVNVDRLSLELFHPLATLNRYRDAAAMAQELTRKLPVLPYSHDADSGGRRSR